MSLQTLVPLELPLIGELYKHLLIAFKAKQNQCGIAKRYTDRLTKPTTGDHRARHGSARRTRSATAQSHPLSRDTHSPNA
jgi:hypothetical protein